MPVELLEFEEPIGGLLEEIEALSTLPDTDQHRAEIARLENRVTQIRGEIYRNLTPWQRVLVARHPSRPATLDYVDKLCTDFYDREDEVCLLWNDPAIGIDWRVGNPVLSDKDLQGKSLAEILHLLPGHERNRP